MPVYVWKEIHINERRPIYMKRDLYIWKETYINEWVSKVIQMHCYCCDTCIHMKRDAYIYMKRDSYKWAEIYIYGKRPILTNQNPRRFWYIVNAEESDSCVEVSFYTYRSLFIYIGLRSYIWVTFHIYTGIIS